ncbi:MAG: hypothetical protein WD042_15545 [Phycisphaeraceae bacterium]
MILKIHCPGCQMPLQVPENASGLRARCPSCRTYFTLPRIQEIFEETISTWIESDVEEEEKTRSQQFQETIGEDLEALTALRPASGAGADSRARSGGRPESRRYINFVPVRPQSLAPQRKGHDESIDEDAAAPVEQDAGGMEDSLADLAPPDDDGAALHVAENVVAGAVAPPPVERSPVPAAPAPGHTVTAPVHAAAAPPSAIPGLAHAGPAAVAAAPAHFPTDLHVTGPVPHLMVAECSQSGVKLGFDSIWLDHLGFRCSMPIRGVFSNNTNPHELRARPLAFVDRSGAAIRSAQDLETRYEQPLLPGWGPRELINSMGILTALPVPFNKPMPYYVDTHHVGLSLACTTLRRPDGGYTCQIMIPNGSYALDWLGRVNGICGEDYLTLEHELAILGSDAWSALPEVCRQRLAAWCQFQPRERFMLYLSDADFGQRDAGLAGLVVTDQRLVYHKFHHSGQIDLALPGTLHIKTEKEFAQLSYQPPGGLRTRVAKLHAADMEQFCAVMQSIPNQIQLMD